MVMMTARAVAKYVSPGASGTTTKTMTAATMTATIVVRRLFIASTLCSTTAPKIAGRM
ncbi:hypothetical protein D3C84_1226080 [compost metagenome]